MNPPPNSPLPERPTFRRSSAAQRNAPWIVVGVVASAFACLAFVVALVGQPEPVSKAEATGERKLTSPQPQQRANNEPHRAVPKLPPVQSVKGALRKKPKRTMPSAQTEQKATPFSYLPERRDPLDGADLPPALKPLTIEEDLSGLDDEAAGDAATTPIADEVVDQLLEQLRTNPSVTNRRNAATSLGKRSDEADKVVPVLLDAARRDPAMEVRIECLKAFGDMKDLGAQRESVLAFLRDITQSAESIENQRIAGDALLKTAPDSQEAKQVLRTALVGGKGTTPVASTEDHGSLDHSSFLIQDWRYWAYEHLRTSRADVTWAIPYLIKIAEKEINSSGGMDQNHIEATASTMVYIGGKTPAVKAHLRKSINAVFPEMENASQLRVSYDTLLKQIEADENEQK